MDCCVVGSVVLSCHKRNNRWFVRMIDEYGSQEIFFGSEKSCHSFIQMMFRILMDAAGHIEND